MTVVYGIKNCDKCRAALKWFDKQAIDYRFHDVRTDGLSKKQVKSWLNKAGSELVNKRSTTWRSLSDSERTQIESTGAVELLLEHPTLIKRPLIEDGAELLVGYDEPAWRGHFK